MFMKISMKAALDYFPKSNCQRNVIAYNNKHCPMSNSKFPIFLINSLF